MAHDFKLDIRTLSKIDALLPRLKFSILPTKIIKWLENFKEEEVDTAIDLLSVYEYIPFNEFMYRLDEQLAKILIDIPEGDKIIILPYGKVGKSATLVTYPLKNTSSFQRRRDDIELTHDFEQIKNPEQYNHIIFIDDFIGSGQTFVTEFSDDKVQNWLIEQGIVNIYLLASIIMMQGQTYILSKFPTIKIAAEPRHKIFDKNKSPLSLFNNFPSHPAICENYKSVLKTKWPFGFDNCESLISFFHCTPNNTLPIIWWESEKWNTLFPRVASIRMDEAREFKKDIAFYFGICNRLGIDIFTGKNILIKRNDKQVRQIEHNSKQDHSIVALLVLKNRNQDDLIICHLLGITTAELDFIYAESNKIAFTDSQKNITPKGQAFLVELNKKTRKENFRKDSEENLTERKVLYLPQMFEGKI